MTESLLDRVMAVRTDLEWSSRIVGRRQRWIAHDPISSAFYYFSDSEYSILKRFDGRKTLREIIASRSGFLNGNLGIQSWSLQTWSSFLSRLDQASLLSNDRSGTSQQRWLSIDRSRQQADKQRWLSLLAIRWQWGDPTRWIGLFEPLGRLLFRRDVFACFAIVSLLVWLSVVSRLWETPQSLLQVDELLQGTRWLGILVAYVFAKLFHELGHLLAARRFGAGCREVGVMWLCLVPCFYCDTTDSWRIEDAKKRAAVAAAGIYFEWIIATIAAWLWLNSTSGGLHAGAANMMLVCSIGTILINANPLVRYDGYYILSDLWSVPNLADQGREALIESFAAGFTGEPMERDRWDTSPAMLVVYGAASFIYRSLLLFAIVWGLWWFLEPRGLGLIAFLLTASVTVGVLLQCAAGITQFRNRVGSHFVMWRGLVVFGTAAACIAFVGLYPIKSYVVGRAVTHFVDSQPLFVPSDATLRSNAKIGDDVVECQTLMELDIPSLRLNRLQLNTEVLALQAKLEALQIRSVEEPASSVELQALTENIAERQKQKALLDARLEQLTVRAKLAGKLIPGTARPVSMLTRSAHVADVDSERDDWLASRNHGALAPEGTLLGWVVDPKRLELRAVISDQDAERVLPEMQVECRWDASPHTTLQGRVVRLSAEPIATTPEALIGDSQLISIRNPNGEPTPERPHYEVVIALTNSGTSTIGGSIATIRIETAPETLFARFERWFRNSLN